MKSIWPEVNGRPRGQCLHLLEQRRVTEHRTAQHIFVDRLPVEDRLGQKRGDAEERSRNRCSASVKKYLECPHAVREHHKLVVLVDCEGEVPEGFRQNVGITHECRKHVWQRCAIPPATEQQASGKHDESLWRDIRCRL